MRFHQLKLVIIEVIERTNFLKTTAQNTTIIPVFLEFENLRMSSPEVSPLPITVRNAEVFFFKKAIYISIGLKLILFNINTDERPRVT